MTAANNLAYLELRLSGGSSNTDPNASLGGVKSSQRIFSKTVAGLSNITGVTLDDAPGSADGQGTLSFTASTKSFTWTPNGGSAGASVAVNGDGRYAIPGSAGFLFLTVVESNLPATNQSDTLTVTQIANALFDDISKVESYAGDIEYRCFYIHNAHPADPFVGAKIYISQQTTGADDIAIGKDPAGIGEGATTGVATTIANEGTAPTGVTFSAPANIGSAIAIGQLNAGQSQAIWEKRNVPAGTVTSTANNLSTLTINAGY
jgi:hypothetical protein